MKLAHIVAIAFISLCTLLSPSTASAKFTLCNRTSQDKLIDAIAETWYEQDQTTGARVVDAESKGWAMISKGSCVEITSDDITFYGLFFFAYSASNPSIKWTGKDNFCIDPKSAFDYIGAKRALQPCPTGEAIGMFFVNTYGQSDYEFPILDKY